MPVITVSISEISLWSFFPESSTSFLSFSPRPDPSAVTSDIRFPFNEIRMYTDDKRANPETAAEMKKIVPGNFDSIVAYNERFYVRKFCIYVNIKLTSKMREYPSVTPRGNKLSRADKRA